jgi:hypothetical protein
MQTEQTNHKTNHKTDTTGNQTADEWREGQTLEGYTLLCKGIRQRRVAEAFARHVGGQCWLWGAKQWCVVRRA